MNPISTSLVTGVHSIRTSPRRFFAASAGHSALRPFLLLGALAASVAFGGLAPAWPWVIALLVAGMAHGAYDIAVIRRQSRSKARRLLVVGVYSAIMLATAALLWLAPALCIVAFLMLSAHHFGVSDSPSTRGRSDLSLVDHLAGLSHGILVLGAPFAFQPALAWIPFEAVAHWVAAAPVAFPSPQLTSAVASVSMVFAALMLIRLRGRSMRDPAGALEQCAVILASILLGIFTDPLFAVGAYFLIVHSSGHCLRADLPGRPVRVPGLANAARVHIESASWFVPSLGVVIAMALWMFGSITLESLAIAFIAFCIVATAPHHLIWLGVRLPGMLRLRAELD